MSLSGTPRALTRAISLPALLARSCCAAVAVACCDWQPTDISGRAGFLDTIASPLVKITGAMGDVAEEADRPASRKVRLLTASSPRVAATDRTGPRDAA